MDSIRNENKLKEFPNQLYICVDIFDTSGKKNITLFGSIDIWLEIESRLYILEKLVL